MAAPLIALVRTRDHMTNRLIPTLSNQLLDGNYPNLVYHVEFLKGGPYVLVNLIGAGPLHCSASPDPPGIIEDIYPPRGELAPLTTDGLRLEITKQSRGPLSETSVVMCGISPPPVDLSAFTMTADFLLSAGNDLSPTAPGDLWAATLVARDSQPNLDANPIDTDFGDTHEGATHQVFGGSPPTIQLGVGKTSPAMPAAEPKQDVYIPGATSGFTLETDIDCHAGLGWSRMHTDCDIWSERSWPYPLVAPRRPWAMIGVGLALARGVGRARVTAMRFSVYDWHGAIPERWWPVLGGFIGFRERKHPYRVFSPRVPCRGAVAPPVPSAEQ
jgi:hypothetical protein